MNTKSIDVTSNRLSSITIDHHTFNNMKDIHKKNYLFQNLKLCQPINNNQSPIEQQDFRSRQTLISILICLLFLTSVTIIVYQILKYFIHENISKKITINCKNTNQTHTR
ncbi:unnamed protein product [Rotaria sp. Silwood1]|nr:unnamed protein product [Rotaria sp. Silwood1]CAF3453795.1 unnamed protein product [Rotaria sp. Silwood1]CAF4602139.1 unnamed protein product [Rotaria sp. Silwood1]